MRQSIVNAGDFVKYHIENIELASLGFEIGQSYQIDMVDGELVIMTDSSMIRLVSIEGELTDFADHFAKIKAPNTLPKGVSK